MRLITVLLVILLTAPLCAEAQNIDIELGTGAAFRGANGDDATESVSHIGIQYRLGRWGIGGGFIYDELLDLDTVERLFIAGRYKIKDTMPFYLEAKIGYTNAPEGMLGDFIFQPGLSVEIPISDEVSTFALGEFTASSNVFMDAMTAQNAVRDSQVGAGIRFRPVVD